MIITQYVSLLFFTQQRTLQRLVYILSIFINLNELVHELVLLLFYARFLHILAGTALRRIQFLLLLFKL